MKPRVTSKLTKQCQAAIPEQVRGVLDLRPGDSVAFDITKDKKVLLRKATPVDFEYARSLEGACSSEWLSENEEEGYGYL